MALKRKKVHVFHTRIKRTTNIINVRYDDFNPMTLIVDFEHSIPANYYIPESQIVYAVYIDREFIKEFFEKTTKFQLAAIDTNHKLEIFAHPHGGFEFIRARQTPGNKIRISFEAKDPAVYDVAKHYIYWDQATGTYLTARMGEIDASTGIISGQYLRSGEIDS
jgi:hypothetical protein